MKVGVTSKSFSSNQPLIDYLSKSFSDYKLTTSTKLMTSDELVDFAQDCDALILALEQINSHVLEQLPNLKVMSKFGVGLDNVDQRACNEAGIALLWTPGVNKGSAAEMTLGFMLMLLRNLALTSRLLSRGEWRKQGGVSLYEKNIGIIGLGNIGKEVVRLLKPFRCNILVNDLIYDEPFCQDYGLIKSSKSTIFSSADIVTVHLPLTSKTHHLINAESINLMKKNAFVINTARGGIIDDEALKEALVKQRISGAALDVYENEPPTDKSFLSLPGLVTTPHIGGNSAEAVFAMGKSAVDNLKTFFDNP